jgi:hypothetical protein
MAMICCDRCGLEIDVIRTAIGTTKINGDVVEMFTKCARFARKSGSFSDLNCADLDTSILAAVREGRI